MRISYSKISSYSFCPKKYQFRYVKMIPVPEKPELAFGIALHSALEENFKQKINSFKDLPSVDVIAAFKKAFSERASKISSEVLTDTMKDEMSGMGEYLIKRFMEERAPSIQPIYKGVECFFSLPLSGDIELSGKFDLVDKKGILHDFKTSSKQYDPHKADTAQLVIYAWACERLFGKYPRGLCFDVFVKGNASGAQKPDFQIVSFDTPSKERVESIVPDIRKKVETIMAGNFPRAFNPERCGWCEYQAECLKELHTSDVWE